MPLEQVAEPVAGPRDIVLDVRACGVCGSDLHIYAQGSARSVGQIMGHEFAGEVLLVGPEVEGIAVGDRVTGLPIQPCGACRRCREGARHLCEVWNTRSVAFGLPGAFAERLRIPDAVLGGNVHALPDNLGFEDGALVEPLAVAVHAVDQAEPRAGQVAVVLGLGTIGLQTAQVLRAAGVTVVGVDLSEFRRDIAGKLGVTAVDGAGDVGATIRGVIGEQEIDFVFEVTGVPEVLQRAVELVRPRGMVVVVALYERMGDLNASLVVTKEVTMRGSAMVTPDGFRRAIELLAGGQAQSQPLITQRMRLDRLGEAFELQLDKNATMKVMIDCS
jgi:(R,R)-butanediol dehydrogenase / meso-butanediol dehydrogenase / diacetyl reductase